MTMNKTFDLGDDIDYMYQVYHSHNMAIWEMGEMDIGCW